MCGRCLELLCIRHLRRYASAGMFLFCACSPGKMMCAVDRPGHGVSLLEHSAGRAVQVPRSVVQVFTGR